MDQKDPVILLRYPREEEEVLFSLDHEELEPSSCIGLFCQRYLLQRYDNDKCLEMMWRLHKTSAARAILEATGELLLQSSPAPLRQGNFRLAFLCRPADYGAGHDT